MSGNDSAFNSPNPFGGANQPGYATTQFNGNIGGPINKKASFFFDAQRRNINDLSAVNASRLIPLLSPEARSSSRCLSRNRTNITPGSTTQLSKNNTLTARYQFFRDIEDNDGIGQFTWLLRATTPIPPSTRCKSATPRFSAQRL